MEEEKSIESNQPIQQNIAWNLTATPTKNRSSFLTATTFSQRSTDDSDISTPKL